MPISGAVEAPHPRVADQVFAVAVVVPAGDVVADVVEQGGVLQQPPILDAEAMERCGGVEQREREGGDREGVVSICAVSLHERHHRAPPGVADIVREGYLGAVLHHPVDDQSVA